MAVPIPIRTADARQLDELLADQVGDHGTAQWRQIDAGHIAGLTTAEAALVERAGEKRRNEFATGRALLRALLGEPHEILRTSAGAPALPDTVVGSLSHDAGIAVGAVAASSAVAAIGIDVEPITELDAGVVRLVLRDDDVVPDPLSAFVAKEAAYKAWSVLGGPMLEHHEVRIVVDGYRYRAEIRGEMELSGMLGQAAGRILATVISPAR